MNDRPDVVVVGGGIVGAAIADAVARDGRSVLVLERAVIGGGATAAGMGHIVVMDDSPPQLALTAYSRRLWQQLLPELTPDAEGEACGTLWVAADDQEMAAVEQKRATLAEAGVRSRVLDGRELAAEEPQLRPELAGGLIVPDDMVVYPPVVAAHLLARAQAHGAAVRRAAAVRSVEPDGTVMLEDGPAITAQWVIVAAGTWSGDLVPSLPVRPRKGHLIITDRYPGFVRRQLIELGYLRSAHSATAESVAFNVQPRPTGQLLIGSSRQFDVADTDVEMWMVDRMLRRALEYMPSLGGLQAIRIWAGHRAATPDKLPLIGPSHIGPRVWLATGHEGLGIATALGTGQLIADQLAGREPAIPTDPYAPARFAVGHLNPAPRERGAEGHTGDG